MSFQSLAFALVALFGSTLISNDTYKTESQISSSRKIQFYLILGQKDQSLVSGDYRARV